MFDFESNKTKLFDPQGRVVVTGLFEELADKRLHGKYVMFKLSDWKDVYVRLSDPTEYKAAVALIGNWEHWQAMLENPVFMSHVEQWRKEVDVKLEAEGIQNLREQARLGNATAARFLAKKEYKEKLIKQKVAEKQEDKESQKIAGDAARLGLKLVSGG